jgi:hypothetical protein
MQANWQFPLPATSPPATSLADLVDDNYPAADANPRLRTRRDRFDFTLIYSACLAVFVWAALIERCNPFSFAPTHGRRRSIWKDSREAAHRCASLAMQA